MNTRGGSRGERNAKPKFSALDINRMYKNSRGESAEPTAQKNQVPRKDGMQSLGKVPSARRPPANLPSLKAETTNSPSINNNITSGQDVATPSSGQISVQLQGTASTTNQHAPAALLKNSNKPSLNNNTNNINTKNKVVGGIGSKLINNSASNPKQRNSTATAATNNHSNSQITWSAVTTGNDSNKGGGGKTAMPPLYQSPQFQHEFPTLDGTVGGIGSGGGSSSFATNKKDQQQNHQGYRDHHHPQHHPHQRDYQHGRSVDQGHDHQHHLHHQHRQHNYRDGDENQQQQQREHTEVNLRSQNEAASWLQHPEKTDKADFDNALNQQGQDLQTSGGGSSGNVSAVVPPPILALMPSFMQRGAPPGNSTAAAGTGRSQTPPNYQNGIGKDVSVCATSRQQRSTDYRSNSPAVIGNNNGSYRQNVTLPKRPPLLNTPPLGIQTSNAARKEKDFIIDPEVVQMQRPIIREEELERLNVIAKDDSWTRTDEIDYNKKLAFSDDESSPEEITSTVELDRVVFNKSGKTDHRKSSNINSVGNNWQRNNKEQQRENVEQDKNRDKEEIRLQQQNGHRSGTAGSGGIALDAGVYERVKQRKEEEERREMERKQAANKKLQELEMKLNNKKVNAENVSTGSGGGCAGSGDSNDQHLIPAVSDDDYKSSQRRNQRASGTGGRVIEYEQQRSRGFDVQRGCGDYARERTIIGNATSNGTQSTKSIFSAHFQSNLPPRFQRQQQMQTSGNGSGGASTTVIGGNSRSITVNNTSQIGGVEKTNSSPSMSFDGGSRYIHKIGGVGGHAQLPSTQRVARGGGAEYCDREYSRYCRSRNDSEREEERYHGGGRRRDDYPRGTSLSKNHLSRSISDTSQRKISHSSNDESVKYGIVDSNASGKDFGSVAIVSSWAEETDAELKRQRDESFSSAHSHESIPIKILQRPQTHKSVSEEETAQQQHLAQPLHSSQLQHKSENESQSHFVPTHILRRSESSDEKSQVTDINSVLNANNTASATNTSTKVELGTSFSNAPSVKQVETNCNDITNNRKDIESSNHAVTANAVTSNRKESISEDKHSEDLRQQQQPTRREQKRRSPRSGGGGTRDRDMRSVPNIRGYGNAYRGGREAIGGSWSRRGGSNVRGVIGGDRGRNYQNEWSESENSEDIEEENYGRRSDRNSKGQRKEQPVRDNRDQRRSGGDDHGDDRSSKEGFAPRGEPSRRGRGGGCNVNDRISSGGGLSSSYRRDGRLSAGSNQGSRQYVRQSCEEQQDIKTSESDHSITAETDKTKQNQLALSAGINKTKDVGDERMQSGNSSKQQSPQPGLGVQAKKPGGEDAAMEKKISINSPPKQFGISKENITNSKSDDSSIVAERETKSLSKEKDIPSGVASQQRNNNSAQRGSSVGSGSITSKKQDLQVASMTSTQLNSVKSQLQQQLITKAPPGLGGGTFKTTSTIAGSTSTNTTTQQHVKSETNANLIATVVNGGSRSANSHILPQRVTSSVMSDSEKSKLAIGEKVSSSGLLMDAPVNTIIFENTNYKQLAQAAATNSTGSTTQIKRSNESLVTVSSGVAGVNVSAVETITNALSQISFAKDNNSTATVASGSSSDYEKGMKLGFSFGAATDSFTSGAKTISDDVKVKSSQQLQIAVSNTNVGQQQKQQQQQNIISTADLNMKIASVKKVWESISPITSEACSTLQQQQQQAVVAAAVAQQKQQQQQLVDGVDMSAASFVAAAAAVAASQQQQQHMPHYAVTAVHMQQHVHSLSSPGPVQNAFGSHGSPFDAAQLEQQFGQVVHTKDGSVVVSGGEDAGYPSPQQQQSASQQQQSQSMSGIMKPPDVVKQQNSTKQMQHHPSPMGMSPPPNLQQQHQPSASQQLHAAAQPFFQSSPQFTAMPTIPSPPAVVFNSSQMPPPPSQPGLYTPFHSLDHSNRSQFSAAAAHNFPGHYNAAAATAGGPYNTYAMQTPPNIQTGPTPEMYSNLASQFRMGGGPSPFGNPNSQQLNNPNTATVAIISSNSNSLMSSVGSVKPPPSSQQLGTIGSKGSAAGGPYAAAAQQYLNLYPGPHPQHPQGGPHGAHQLQSNSYYSNSAGGPNGPTYYGGPPPPQSNGTGAQSYSLAAAASLYGGHAGHQAGPPGSTGPQGPPPNSQHAIGNFNAQFMNSPLLTAAAINQFRGAPTPQQQAQAAAAYMKSSQGQSHMQDSMGRQLKSPLGADVSLNLAKQVQSQPSPPHHKNYGNWDLQSQVMQQQQQQRGAAVNQQNMNPPGRSGGGGPPGGQGQGRYPTPIQRPTNYPQHPPGPPQSQQQQQAPQQGQQRSMRQGSAGGNAGPQGGGGPCGPNVGPASSNNGGCVNGNGGQQQQINKPYYTNNGNGANRVARS